MLQELQEAALRLKGMQPAVRSVTLFGSFAVGVLTPRSDAASSYADLFQDVSVPVEVFVCTSGELATSLEEGWGVAAVAPCARSTGSLRPFGPCCQLN